jgi:integrase
LLTDKQCRAATLEGGKAKLFDGNGLYLELLKSGAKSWRWKYRLPDGKEKRLTFGLYPTVSLKDARIEREKAAALLRTGVDPAIDRSGRSAVPQDEPTFQEVALDWHTSQTKLFDPRHAKRVKRALENDVFPTIGKLPISQVTSPQIVTLLRAIEARGSADVAHRARQRISDIFVYALASAIVKSNPAAEMGKALGRVRKRRYPAVQSIEAARALLKTVEAKRVYPLTRAASRLLALTAVRSGVLRLAEVAEFEDLDGAAPIWRIPAAKMKLAQERRDDPAYEFIVPLSKQAVEVVKVAIAFSDAKGLIFRSIRFEKRPISDSTISKLYREAGYAGVHPPHGWRATFSTVMNRLAAEEDRKGDREVIDLMLAHVAGSVEAIYNRYAYMPRRREIAQEWADMLTVGLMPPERLVEGPRHP